VHSPPLRCVTSMLCASICNPHACCIPEDIPIETQLRRVNLAVKKGRDLAGSNDMYLLQTSSTLHCIRVLLITLGDQIIPRSCRCRLNYAPNLQTRVRRLHGTACCRTQQLLPRRGSA
jgi:hypothetical protein